MKKKPKRPSPQRGARAPASKAAIQSSLGVRQAAIAALVETVETGRYIDETLSSRLPGIDPRDRRLLQEIGYGVLRHLNTLDQLINFHLRLTVDRQKPAVMWALRIGAYQIVYLSRVPDHAAVNQTVEALKSFPDTDAKAPGFVNAVLHKLAGAVRRKTEDEPIDPDDPTVIPIRDGYCHFDRPFLKLIRLDRAAHLSLKYSMPQWLISRWVERFGEEETKRLCEAQNRTPSVTARVMQNAPSRDAVFEALKAEGLEARPGSLDDSIVFTEAAGLEGSKTLAKGWIQVQDETAIRIGSVLNPPAGARVLDLCAAPGGKALQLLEQVGPTGHVTAADRTEEKLELVRRNLSRAGGNFTTVLVPEDPDAIALSGTFTHVLVDTPCSNSGVFARRPEARWRVRAADLKSLSSLQSKLFEAGLRHLAPGGRIVYATCSVEPEENENVIARAFALHSNLTEVDTKLFLPHRIRGDGGFYSLLLLSRT